MTARGSVMASVLTSNLVSLNHIQSYSTYSININPLTLPLLYIQVKQNVDTNVTKCCADFKQIDGNSFPVIQL